MISLQHKVWFNKNTTYLMESPSIIPTHPKTLAFQEGFWDISKTPKHQDIFGKQRGAYFPLGDLQHKVWSRSPAMLMTLQAVERLRENTGKDCFHPKKYPQLWVNKKSNLKTTSFWKRLRNNNYTVPSGNLNVAMQNSPFVDVFPIRIGRCSIAMVDHQIAPFYLNHTTANRWESLSSSSSFSTSRTAIVWWRVPRSS